jgi:hypothetical protein
VSNVGDRRWEVRVRAADDDVLATTPGVTVTGRLLHLTYVQIAPDVDEYATIESIIARVQERAKQREGVVV